MTTKLLCVDSDIFTLFAAAGRLHRAAELAGFPPDTLRRLPALASQLRRGGAFRGYPPAARAAALAAAEGVAPLDDRPADDDAYQRLLDGGIDPGEANLFALMAERPVYWMATGDVRAMTALAAAANLDDIRRLVAGRVVCVEAVFHLLIAHDGHAATAAAFDDARRPSDAKLRALIGPPGPDGPLAGAQSYLRDLCRQVGGPGRLLMCPPCPAADAGICTLEPDPAGQGEGIPPL